MRGVVAKFTRRQLATLRAEYNSILKRRFFGRLKWLLIGK